MTMYKRSILWVSFSISLTALAPEAGAAVCGCDAIAPNNLKAMLPNPGLAGQISRVTDDSHGLWLNNGANKWTEIGGVTNVKDFGAVGDGNTDDTVAIQAAINSLPTGGMLYFPPTSSAQSPGAAYVITQTLTVVNVKGLSLVGSARSGTVIQWGSAAHPAPPGIPMIQIKNGFRVSVKSMAIYGNPNPANRPSAIIDSLLARDQLPAGDHASAELFFEDLVLGGDSAGMATKGIVLDKTPLSADNANDVFNFHRVEITNTVEAAVSVELNQSKAHTFVDCRFLYSKRGVATNLGAGFQGGSFRWYGGDISGSTVADFDLGNNNDAILISGMNGEGSARLLQTGGPASAAWPVTIEGVRWAASGINPDGKMIYYQLPGPLNVIGNLLGDGNSLAQPPTIFLNFATDGVANIVGNTFLAPNSVNSNPISTLGPGPYRIVMQGNTFSDAVGAAKLRSDPSTVEGAYAGMLGISATTTASKNLRGSITAGGAGTATVVFPVPEPDAQYYLSVTPTNFVGNLGANRVLFVQKLPTGFTIIQEAPGAATFDWVLIR